MADLVHHALARQLRRRSTPAERKLWQLLRGRPFGPHKFRRQHPLRRYVLDFYCAAAGLAIEIDGAHHSGNDQLGYDEARSRFLAALGIRVVRFSNQQILEEPGAVLDALERILGRKS